MNTQPNTWKRIAPVVAACMACLISPQLLAEDIDIYSGVDPSAYGNPNVLIVLDNTSNWARQSQQWPGGLQQGQSEVKAIEQAISGLGANAANINIGIMEFVTNGNANQDGGFIRRTILPMTSVNQTNLNTSLDAAYAAITSPDEKRNSNTPYGDLMYDVYNYFAGANVSNDGSNTSSTLNPPNPSVDAGGYSTNYSRFNSPLSSTNPCAKNYVIFISNPNASGPATDSSANTSALHSLISSATLNGVALTNAQITALETQLPLPGFTSSQIATSTVAGNSTQCYADQTACNAAGAGAYSGASFASDCSDANIYPNGCSCGAAVSGGGDCPSGQNYYMIKATEPAGTAVTTATSNDTYALDSQTLPTKTAPPGWPTIHGNNAETFKTCPSGQSLWFTSKTTAGNKYSYGLACELDNSSSTNLGYTSSCKTAASSCGSSDFSSYTSSYPNPPWTLACDSNTYTSTGSSCSSGTSLFQISGNSYITTNVPTGTYTTDNHPFNMDEWARLLYEIGVPVTGSPNQTVTTYTIDVYNAQENGTHTSLMLSAAAAGGGKYYSATNQQAIVTAITKITSEILAVNSNFSSASLPASVNAQGTYRNQVFIGMFRPNADSSPRWLGNMKQYQLGYDANGALGLFDDSSPPQSAVSNTTGFLTPSAKSFWTNSVPNYWPDESPYATSYGGLNGSPDGELVEKGGAAQKLRALSSASNRNTLTCVSPCSSLIPFTAGNTGLNSDLVSWALGATSTLANTAAPDDATLPSGYAMRRSAHGDVVHSRPVAIDFGSGGAHDVKVFYGANDGFLHAITANTTSTEGGELWSFIAPEQWSNLNRLYNNSPNINNPSIPGSSNNKTYFFDGPIGNYRSSDNTTTWIFPTTRRGGRMIYAFDVSNSGGSTPTSPNNPTLLWRHGCTTLGNDTGCDSGWSSIGQTWSQPTAISVSGYTDPVLIMGGGYDNCEDADPVVDCSASKGKSVMLIDATAGTLLASLATDRAVATDMALLDTTGDQKVDTAYAVDTGGNVYRIKLNYNGTDWSNSTITKIAALGCNTTSATCTQSKFLNAPSAIALSGYNMVLVGSGDREHPLRTNTSNGNNEFFMIEDRSSNPLIGRDMLAQADPTTTGYSGITPTTYGWRLELPAYKEAVVTSSVVAGQGVYFSTFSPTATTSASVCTADLGTAKACAVKWQNAAPLTLGQNICDTFPAGGLPPSPILVTVTDIYGASSGNGTNGSPSTATVIIGGYPANTTVPLTNPSSCATDPTTCVCGTATTPPCPAYCGNPTVPTCNPAAPIQGCYTPVSAACQRAGVYWNMEKD